MTDSIKNISTTKHMIELIAERSGENRADVFLDIIIDIIFNKNDVWRQQQIVNYIANNYGIKPPTLTFGSDEDVPF